MSIQQDIDLQKRQDRLITNKAATAQACITCKLVSALLFGIGAAFHGYRVNMLWRAYPTREKIFNVAAITGLVGISGLNLNAGFEIYKGRNMIEQNIEFRPSIMRRLFFGELTNEQKRVLLKKEMEVEELKLTANEAYKQMSEDNNNQQAQMPLVKVIKHKKSFTIICKKKFLTKKKKSAKKVKVGLILELAKNSFSKSVLPILCKTETAQTKYEQQMAIAMI